MSQLQLTTNTNTTIDILGEGQIESNYENIKDLKGRIS